jgi:putative spermidine/putrescine transport system permease protein
MKSIWLVLVSLGIAFSLLSLFILSFAAYFPYPLLLPEHFSLQFWENTLVENSLFCEGIVQSMVLGSCSAFFATLIGIMAGRALERYDFTGKVLVGWLVSLPLFIPAIVLFMGVHSVMIQLTLVNTYLGVVISHVMISIPYTTHIFRDFFRNIPVDMEEVAKTLGSGNRLLYQKILLPLLMPGLILSFGISFLLSFSEYFSTFLIGGGRIITLSMVMYPYIANGDMGNGSVMGMVFLGINMGIFYVLDRVVTKKMKEESYLEDEIRT